MSTPTAKDLLAQADRLMRQRTPEELPVLTDLVIEEIEIPSLTDRMEEVIPTHARPAWAASSTKPFAAPAAVPPSIPAVTASPVVNAADVLGVLPRITPDAPSSAALAAGPSTVTALASVRDQFNAQLLIKLEELQHSVYSQVMQQLEVYSAGSLKAHLRETLLPALTDIARDIADQVAEDTATQVREVVSKAVDSEIARLREQLSKRRL